MIHHFLGGCAELRDQVKGSILIVIHIVDSSEDSVTVIAEIFTHRRHIFHRLRIADRLIVAGLHRIRVVLGRVILRIQRDLHLGGRLETITTGFLTAGYIQIHGNIGIGQHLADGVPDLLENGLNIGAALAGVQEGQGDGLPIGQQARIHRGLYQNAQSVCHFHAREIGVRAQRGGFLILCRYLSDGAVASGGQFHLRTHADGDDVEVCRFFAAGSQREEKRRCQQ